MILHQEFSKNFSLKNPICLALDLENKEEALALAAKAASQVGCLKIGPRLGFQLNSEEFLKLSLMCPIFLDYKFYDIPSTMAASVRAAFELGVQFVTVHLTAGEKALKEVVAVRDEYRKKGLKVEVFGVSVLTSFSEVNLPNIYRTKTISELALELIKIGCQSGVESFVCSAQELKELLLHNPKAFAVVPGVQFGEKVASDQARTVGPREALISGASLLVIGRSIISATNPIERIEQILEDIRPISP